MRTFWSAGSLAAVWPRRWWWGFGITAVLGFALPFGLLGNIPIARQLQHKGMPVGLLISFLLASAVINPLTLINSRLTLGLPFTAGRVALALLVAALASGLFTWLSQSQISLSRPLPPSETLPPTAGRTAKLWAGLAQGGDDLVELGAYWVLGSLLTAVVAPLLPDAWLFHPLGVVMFGFLSAPPGVWLSDTAVWFTRALPTPFALAYLTSNSLLPLAAALLHTRLWHGRGWFLLVAVTLLVPLLLSSLTN